MYLAIANLYGTVIEHNLAENIIYEKGMFNALGYTKSHQINNFRDIDSLIELFDRRAQLKQDQGKLFL